MIRQRTTPCTDQNDIIKALAEGKSYKYLGVHQVIRSEPGRVKDGLREVYLRRLCQIWKAPLNGRNKIHATNIWAVSLFRYYFSSPLKWTKTFLKELDRTTRAVLRKHWGHYLGASVERLYLQTNKGGGRLQNLTHVFQRETLAAVAYFVASDDPIHQSIVEHMRWTADRKR